jgi:hypothetical protein
MAVRRLRVYTGPEADRQGVSVLDQVVGPREVRVTLGDILPLLADAVESQRTWLQDFAEDEIAISSDLHDVLQAYRHFRRPSA